MTTPTQPAIFTPEQCPPPPRPRRSDPAVLDAAMDLLWPKIVTIGVPDGDAESRASVRSELGLHDDGYSFARALERDGWDPDFALAEVLDGASYHLHTAHDKAVEAWVATYGWPCRRLPPGTRVRAKVGGRWVEGEVSDPEHGADRYARHAHYLLFCASEGHVRAGLGSHGFIVDAESVEVLSASAVTGEEQR